MTTKENVAEPFATLSISTLILLVSDALNKLNHTQSRWNETELKTRNRFNLFMYTSTSDGLMAC